MGETADMILEGMLCQQCGVYIDDREPGYPRTCDSCLEENKPRTKNKMQSKFSKPTTGQNAVKGVKNFLTGKREQNQTEAISAYGKELGMNTDDEVIICESIQEDFSKFVKWYKKL